MAVKRYNGTSWDTVAGLGAQGAAATSSSITTWVKTASGGETSLTGSSDSSTTLAYTPGQEQVFINGVLQVRGSDYTATNGTSITGLTALVAGDIATVTSVNAFSVTGAVPLSTVTANGDLIVGTSSGAVGRLGIGSTSQVLTVSSGVPTWATPAAPTFVGCALYMDANQTLTNNTVTNLTWGAENFDTDSFHSTVTNTSRITIPSGKDGKYLFAWSVAYFANATGIRETALRKNGTSITYQDFPVSSNGSETNMTATYVANAVAGDYFELAGYQNSGGNLDVRSGTTRAFFHCTYLGA